MSVTQEIKSRLDLVDIASETVSLRKSGKNYAAFCPFHSNTRTPSFYIFPETQTWRCFGACAEGGDLFSFVMKKEGWDFKESLKHLAQKAGITLKEPTPAEKKRRSQEDKLVDLLTAAADFFHQLLLHAPQAKFAREYINGRQLSEETQATFRLGFALDSWDACRTHFNAQGYSDDDLLKTGLLTENEERGTRYDRFRNRLMIPIRDSDGRTVGFGARTLAKDGIPKYLNSPQTPLFDKSRLLYGLDGAKRHIREARQVAIVEGYMDVMQGWQAGFRNIVAQMGTALTPQQLQMLKRYTKRFVIALDADAAGVKATMRSLQVARENLDREYETRFDASGLVRHEGRLKADIRIVTLPEGNDPDSIIRNDPVAWPKLLAKAQSVVAYVIDTTTRDLDMQDAKAKSAVAQQVLPLINEVADPIEREHYRQQLARALSVDERSLRLMSVPTTTQRKPQPRQIPPEPPPPPDELSLPYDAEITSFESDPLYGEAATFGGTPPRGVRKILTAHKREANFLRQCLTYPQMISQVNRWLTQQKELTVAEDEFPVSEDRALLRLIYERAQQTAVVTLEELCDSLDVGLVERLQALLSLSPTLESELDRLPERLTLSVLDWRLVKAQAQLAQLQQLVVAANSESEPNADLTHMRGQQIKRIQQINKAKAGMSSFGKRNAENGSGRK